MKRITAGLLFILSFFIVHAAAQTAAEQRFAQGVRLAAGGKYAEALPAFEAAARDAGEEATDDFRARVEFNVGVCLYRTGRAAEAVAALEAALRRKPDYEKAFYALGMAETDRRNWAAAEKAFLAAVRLNPRNGETWLDLGFVYLAANDYDAAAAAFQKAIARGSVDAALAHNNLGVILALRGEVARAVAAFERAVRASNGKLAVAGRNLRFCRELSHNPSRELLAGLEFSEF